MPNYPETLGEALIAEDHKDQADLLTAAARALTRAQVINIINTAEWPTGFDDATKKSIRDVSVMRAKAGQPVFPWNDAEFFDGLHNEFHAFVY